MKILICTDGSRSGLSAIYLGGAIAARLKAETTLLCVVDSKRRDPQRAFKRATKAIQQLNLTADKDWRKGQLLEEMLAHLLIDEYDLVIVGYYARGFLEKMLWGSLAARIAHELPISVLIVRDPRDTIKRIIVGIAGGGYTAECAEWGGVIAAAFDARVRLLHVSTAPPLMYAGLEVVVEDLAEFLQTDTLGAQALKQAVAHIAKMGVEAKVELVHGLPERELLRVAQDKDVDLLILGSSWVPRPMVRALRRNITEKVLLNTRRPVLIVRPNE